MENKIELNLGGGYSLEELKDAVVTGFGYEYLVYKIIQVIRQYSHVDFKGLDGEIGVLIDDSRDVTFAKLTQWTKHKRECYQKLLATISTLDEMIANSGAIILGEVAETLKGSIIEFLLNLTRVKIQFNFIDFGDVKVNEDIYERVLEEISIIDQTEMLIGLSLGTIQIEPTDVANFRNTVVEKKIVKLGKIVNSVKSSLNRDFNKLHGNLVKMYSDFYKLSESELMDGDKESKSRHIVKMLSSHKDLLDKLQDKMSEGNELKRQLVLNRNKLQANYAEQIQNYDRRLNDGEDSDIVEREKMNLDYVISTYVNQINGLIKETNQIDENISKKYDIVDKLIVTLKTAIPSESEMKRFSNIAYKFQELSVKLAMTKVQMEKKNKDISSALNTATAGLDLLVKLVMDGKEIFVKNSLMSAMFNSVNNIYDLVDREDKLKEIEDIKMVTTSLAKYSVISDDFQKGLVDFRKIARDGLSAIAIMMGKEYDGKGLVEIVDKINETFSGIQSCFDKLKDSNGQQAELLKDILLVYKNEE